MADVAMGKVCPNDGTLTTCTGDYDSSELAGTCPYCGQTVTMPHHRVERVAIGEHPVAPPTFVQVTGSAVAVSPQGTVTTQAAEPGSVSATEVLQHEPDALFASSPNDAAASDVTQDFTRGTHSEQMADGGTITVTNTPVNEPPSSDTMSPFKQDSFHEQPIDNPAPFEGN